MEYRLAETGAADSLCNDHDVCSDAVIDIREMVDVLARDDRAFSGSERAQGHERQAEFIRVDQTDRRALGNDLAENARHRVARFGLNVTPEACQKATVCRHGLRRKALTTEAHGGAPHATASAS
jgi:hypothetical protein